MVRQLKHRVFYGWWVVGALCVSLMVSSGTGFYTFGVFMTPLMSEFGWARGPVAATISIYWLATGCAGPFVGWLIDTYGPRRVLALSAVLNGVCLLLLSLTPSLWYLYLIYALKAVAHSGLGLIAVGAVISRWFIRRRGRATGIAVTGIGFGGLFLIPFVGYLMPIVGWRAIFAILGVVVWAVLIPLITLVVRASPAEKGLLPDGGTEPAPAETPTTPAPASAVSSGLEEWTLSQASRTPSFWLVAAAYFSYSLAMFGVLTHEVPYFTDMGISSTAAATALGFTAGMGVAGKLAAGYLADRLPVRYVAILCYALQAVGVLLLMGTRTIEMVWVFVIVFGLAMGATATLQPLIVAAFFGVASIGAILGAMTLAFAFGAATGPFMAGYVYDLLGSYYWAFVVFLAAYAVAVLALLLARGKRLASSAYPANDHKAGER